MPPRRVYNDGSTAATITRWLLKKDWKTRHAYLNILKRMPRKANLVRHIRELMSPCELIDGLDTGIKCTSPDLPIPMPNAKPKRYRQSTLNEFFKKRLRV